MSTVTVMVLVLLPIRKWSSTVMETFWPRVAVPNVAVQFPCLADLTTTTAPGMTLSSTGFSMMGRNVVAYAGSFAPPASGDDPHPTATINPMIATTTPDPRRHPMVLRPGPLNYGYCPFASDKPAPHGLEAE